jgi:hypothetical protein
LRAYRALSVLGGVALAALLCACAFVDTVDPRYDSVNRSTAKARNESILLNLVRAAHAAPLNFVAFSKVSGTTAVGVNAGLPAFSAGPRPLVSNTQRQFVFGNTTLNGSTSANTSYDISIMENRDFYLSLLRPVDLATLNFFIRQGYSRQLLFWLFADTIEEVIGNHTYGYHYEPGKDDGCAAPRGRRKCFGDLIDIAFLTGLTVESKAVEKGGGGGKKGASGVYSRFCFDRVLAERAERDLPRERIAMLATMIWSRQHLPACRMTWNPADQAAKSGSAETDTLEFLQPNTPVGTVRYRIVTRSTFGIYQFLGRLLAEGLETSFLSGDKDDPRLLTVIKDGGPQDCFETVWYTDGAYCVPNNAKNTKQIVQLMAQLLALQTQASDLAITPTVRVTP